MIRYALVRGRHRFFCFIKITPCIVPSLHCPRPLQKYCDNVATIVCVCVSEGEAPFQFQLHHT